MANQTRLLSAGATPALVLAATIVILSAANLLPTASAGETLIIVNKSTFNQTHSQFVNIVQQTLGHNVHIKVPDSTLKLSKYGEYLYDNIVIMGDVGNVNDIVDFIDSGRNLLLIGSHASNAKLAELANQVGFDIKGSQTKPRDYSAHVKINSNLFHLVGETSKYPSTSFTYMGNQIKMVKSDLTYEVLTNSLPVDDIRPTTSSSKVATNVLIGALQAKNNARVVVSGSIDFFADQSLNAPSVANKALTIEILRWLFKEKSLLRYSDVRHRKLNVNPSPSTDIASRTNFEGYTIMDDIEYSIKIEIFENGNWKPYDGDDVQLEFVRIDPFVRQTMKAQPDGTYVAQFKVPDVYGVYKFQVDYKKDCLTHLFSSTQVSVRPLRHNEYERYIYSAYPYYLSAFLMVIYLYIFSFVYLYQQKEKRSNK